MQRFTATVFLLATVSMIAISGCQTEQGSRASGGSMMPAPAMGNPPMLPPAASMSRPGFFQQTAEKLRSANPFQNVSRTRILPGGAEGLVPTPDAGMPPATSVPSLF